MKKDAQSAYKQKKFYYVKMKLNSINTSKWKLITIDWKKWKKKCVFYLVSDFIDL